MGPARPWEANVEGDGDVFAGDLQIADCDLPQGELSPEDIRAIAALIVRAVNCHDDLLAALKRCVGVLRENPAALAAYGAHYAIQDGDAAIAKAESA